ncbi:MAG TPA: penicillin-binding protein 2 [Gammaproteobacteria bacterium]|nr:penicillin-binding protein 2 [Gammaproteobacteria bacterium]HET7586612.1 penicillin-binding protein 2 [Gammaproteobacteria bacterium]
MSAEDIAVGTGWRGAVVLAAFVLVAGGLAWRAFSLEIFDNDFLLDQGAARHLRVVPIPAHRGMITDRTGRPLAVSTPVDSIWVNPQEFTDFDRIGELARALHLSPASVRDAIESHSGREFYYLQREMSPADANRVLALDLEGIHVEHEYRRYYPAGEVVSHVLGFTNIDDAGQEGLELAYNDWLQGKPGAERVIRDRLGHIIQEVASLKDPKPGRDLVTSIDLRIQYLAYRDLKAAVEKQDAKSGSVVVLDPNTGEVIAMANQPAFNPNDRSDFYARLYRNRAVTDVFEPGSSFKPFTIAAALETDRYTPATKVDTAPGWIVVDGYTINDHRDYGVITLTTLLEKSSNVGASMVALSLTPEHMWSIYDALGFGHYTGSGFPGERTGVLRPYRTWRKAGQAAISYGYGVSVTALQLTRAYAAIATGGILPRVSFLRLAEPPAGRRVLPEQVADELRMMLETVVTDPGTGTLAEVPNYRVSGKTGTAHKAVGGGYSADHYTSVFCGMIPAEHPRLVACVVINDPSNGDYYGGLVAAPVFADVMTGAMRILDVPPDDISSETVAGVVHLEGKS